MYYVYLIEKRHKTRCVYYSFVSDLKIRYEELGKGRHFDEKIRPFKIVHTEAFHKKKDAVEHNYRLKHHGNIRDLDKA